MTPFAAVCMTLAGTDLAVAGAFLALWLIERGRNRENAALAAALRNLRETRAERDSLRFQLAAARHPQLERTAVQPRIAGTDLAAQPFNGGRAPVRRHR